MKITELRVSVAKTVNLGNYNSIRLEAGATVAIEDGDDLDAVRAEMMTEINTSLHQQWDKFRRGE
ncbi:conserved protein of unknown function (plasmid) [Rhodovastum atsumiense]|uniref:Uncharacterized protein n=1 Tax=Rhodovastum atsumiense TaxID=504468 RepID=A0A5M6IQD7_9PROT|nr:hypothetical protein [Rhodovastum atsumiense]KAA5609695.1 hypothetical protein F1189_23330 [Rhodovastum atsumiense]CAH2606477.1 conserved protein of unknown function [Rhodovastum atsumiense]